MLFKLAIQKKTSTKTKASKTKSPAKAKTKEAPSGLEAPKKLVILVKGKTVLSGRVDEIKSNYRKKNIIIKGDISIDELKSIDGVIDVIDKNTELEVKIEDSSVVDKVFKKVSKKNNITKFVLEEPSLNEIFISKVGEAYEK